MISTKAVLARVPSATRAQREEYPGLESIQRTGRDQPRRQQVGFGSGIGIGAFADAAVVDSRRQGDREGARKRGKRRNDCCGDVSCSHRLDNASCIAEPRQGRDKIGWLIERDRHKRDLRHAVWLGQHKPIQPGQDHVMPADAAFVQASKRTVPA